MSTSAPTPTAGTAGAHGTPGTTLTPTAGTGLGENDFLTLMMDQLKNQDPTSPSDPTQFLSELASFSSLEQETSIASSSTQAASQQSTSAALGLLGKSVTYTDSQGHSQTGTVGKVDITSSGPTLTVGTTPGVPFSSVTEVTSA